MGNNYIHHFIKLIVYVQLVYGQTIFYLANYCVMSKPKLF